MRAAHVGACGSIVRAERLSAAKRVVEHAIAHDAAFVVVAGDTFEDNNVDRGLIQRVADTLASFPRDVYLLPGNHDPLVPGSVWDHPAWARPNLHVLSDLAPISIEGGTLWPCPLREKWGRADPTAWIGPREPSHGIRIGIAHGTVEGLPTTEPYFPIPRDVATRRGLDYVAIGHWHSFASYPSADGGVRLAYSGTHETTKFGERDSGNALLIEIEAVGAVPVITPLRTGRLRWTQWTEECRADGDVARLIERLEVEPSPDATLLNVTLRGLATVAERQQIGRLRELAEARMMYHRIDDTELRPAPTDGGWIDALPDGLIRATARRLQTASDPTTAARSDGMTPADSGRALAELYAIVHSAEAAR